VAPVLSAAASDKSGRISFTVTESGAASSYKVFRSSGGAYTEITSNCSFSGIGTGTGTVIDKRPRYGTPSIVLDATGYYKVQQVSGGVPSADSNIVSAVSALTKATVEREQWDALHTAMQDTTLHNGSLGYAYPGFRWLSAAYIAVTYSDKRTQALADLSDWWTTSKAHIAADGLYHWETSPTVPAAWAAASSAVSLHSQYCSHFIMYALSCARLLKSELPADATAQTVSADMLTKADAMGKAMIDHLTCFTYTKAAYGASWVAPAAVSAWSAGASVAPGDLRRPTVATGRMYRALPATKSPYPASMTTGGSQPTWPTTDRGYVTDNQVVWQDCTNDIPAWSSAAAITAGAIVRPTVVNSRTYRALNTGTTAGSEPTWPTSDGGFVTDNGITWLETTGITTGGVFKGYYDVSTYAAAGTTAEVVGDYPWDYASAFALLLSEPTLSGFQPGGSYQATAALIVADSVSIGASAQVGIGGLAHQWTTVPEYDTAYGSYAAHKAAITAKMTGNRVAALVHRRAVNWLETDFATEPRHSNDGYPDAIVTDRQMANISWRRAIGAVAGRPWASDYLFWDSSYRPGGDDTVVVAYDESGHTAASTTDAGAWPLTALGIDAALRLGPNVGGPAFLQLVRRGHLQAAMS
jgi:hypothetical protein